MNDGAPPKHAADQQGWTSAIMTARDRPVLYHNDMSVCAAKVRNLLSEKGIDFAGVHLNLRAGDAQKPDYVTARRRSACGYRQGVEQWNNPDNLEIFDRERQAARLRIERIMETGK